MTCYHKYLHNYCELLPYVIVLGNNIVITATSMSNICRIIYTNSIVNTIMLNDVLHIPQVAKILAICLFKIVIAIKSFIKQLETYFYMPHCEIAYYIYCLRFYLSYHLLCNRLISLLFL